MSEKLSSKEKRKSKTSSTEKVIRFGRDFNIFVGSVALVGAVIAPPVVGAGLGIYAAINFAQAGGFEAVRRTVKKRKKRQLAKSKSQLK